VAKLAIKANSYENAIVLSGFAITLNRGHKNEVPQVNSRPVEVTAAE